MSRVVTSAVTTSVSLRQLGTVVTPTVDPLNLAGGDGVQPDDLAPEAAFALAGSLRVSPSMRT